MKLQHNEALQFAKGLASREFSIEHLLEAFDHDEEVIQQIIDLSKTIEPEKVERFNLL